MTAIIERVAAAIIEYQHKFCQENPYEGLADIDPLELALVAIEAMCEPTDDMIGAGSQAWSDTMHWDTAADYPTLAEHVWKAMHRAAKTPTAS